MKRLSIFLQLVLLLIYSSITVDGAGGAFDDRKITAIKILPYRFDPARAPDEVVLAGFEFSTDHHYGHRYTNSKREPNEYNLSKTFAYVAPREIGESIRDVPGYMHQVVAYHKVFNTGVEDPKSNKNVLLVRVRITATIQAESESASGSGGCSSTSAAESSHEYFFGIFVSGAQKYRCGEVRDLISVSKEYQHP